MPRRGFWEYAGGVFCAIVIGFVIYVVFFMR
jgi:hypothetical protein